MIKTIHKFTDSIGEVFALLFAVILVAGTLFSYIEGETLFRSMYWATITATSVGYGDISPKTQAGMVLAMATAVAGLIAMAFVIAKVYDVLVHDHHAFDHEEQELIKQELKEIKDIINAKE